MCDWCVKHGAGGRWFENTANYARNMFRLRKKKLRSEGAGADPDIQTMAEDAIYEAVKARNLGDVRRYEDIKKQAEAMAHSVHFGQVVTLEQVKKIVEIAYPIARISCVCRRRTRGLKDEENFFCMGVGVGMYKWERWPETYRGGVHFMSPDEAKEWLENVNELGAVHTFWVFGTPYIGGICNCEYPACIGMRNRLDYGIKILIKGEYYASVDRSLCTGCGICIERCQFGAITIERSILKACINPFRCFGCGLCVRKCRYRAINLKERAAFKPLEKEW